MTLIDEPARDDTASNIGVRTPRPLREAIEAAAGRELISVSAWMRRAALRELTSDTPRAA